MLPAFLKETRFCRMSQLVLATQIPANALTRRISFATVGFSQYLSMTVKICRTSRMRWITESYHKSSSQYSIPIDIIITESGRLAELSDTSCCPESSPISRIERPGVREAEERLRVMGGPVSSNDDLSVLHRR